MKKVYFLLLAISVVLTAFAQKQITNTDRTIIQKCYNLSNGQFLITASTSNDYLPSETSRHGVSNVLYEFNIYVIDSNLNVVEHHILNDNLKQYTEYSINNNIFSNGNIIFTGRGLKSDSLVRFTGLFNLKNALLTITNEINYGFDSFPQDANHFEINDSLMGIDDFLSSNLSAHHFINQNGEVTSKYFKPEDNPRLGSFTSQIITDSLIYLKSENFNVRSFNTTTLEFNELSTKQFLSSSPSGIAVSDGVFYYMIGAWYGVDDDGFFDPGWSFSRAHDIFLYTFDNKFNLLRKAEITDKDWYQQMFTEFRSTQCYVMVDSTLKVTYTGFPDATATGFLEKLTGEKFEDSKLTFATLDLQGNLLDKKEFFENDGKNHFNWFTLKNSRGYLLVNTVLDIDNFPDTTTNLELMQLDNEGVLVGINTIFNKNIGRLNTYPNPAQSNGQVNLSWSGIDNQNWQLQLYDNQGRMVHSTNISQAKKEVQLQLPELPKGNYILRATGSNKQVHTGTVLVE